MADLMAGIEGAFETAVRTAQMSGAWGVWAIILLFVVSAVSLVPRPALCVMAGSAYGFWGIPIAFTGTLVGASIAFLLGFLLRTRLGSRIARRPAARRIFEAVGKEGWRIVVLCRLAPIAPSSLQSLVFGASSISFLPYCLATAAGIVPGIILEIAFGAGLTRSVRGELSWIQTGLFGFGILAGLIALTLVGRRLRAELRAEGLSTRSEAEPW